MWACVIAADQSIPDNPNGPNQSQSAEKANLSEAKCDGVVLDRAAPTVAITATASAKVGELVSFGAQASDAGSGLAPGYEWTYGDNTAAGSGESVSHTYTQPGTYEVRVKASDAAGNAGWARKVVTVTAPPSGGDGDDDGSSDGLGDGPSGGGTGGGGSTGGGSTGGGSTGGSTGGGSTDPGDGAGSDDAPGESAGFEVSAPRKLKLAKAKALPIALTAEAGGKVSVALVRSGRVLARGSKAIAAGTSTYRLKLPRKAKAGRYVLKVTFTPQGGTASTSTRKVTLAGKAKKAGRASASGARAPRVSAAGAPVALPDGKFHGVRKRSFVPRARSP